MPRALSAALPLLWVSPGGCSRHASLPRSRPVWNAGCVRDERCELAVFGAVLLETARGDLRCAQEGGWLACLWTHINGFYQEGWFVELSSRKVSPLSLPAWDSGDRVVSGPRGENGAVELLLEYSDGRHGWERRRPPP